MVIFNASSTKPEVALMFDDGPNPQVTPRLLDVLKAKNTHATFFLIGARAEKYPSLVRRIVQEGHEVGNHTYTHKRLTDILVDHGVRAVREEIEKGARAIAAAADIEETEIRFLRPPYLDWNDQIAKIARPIYGDHIVMTPLAIEDYEWGADRKWESGDYTAIASQSKRIIRSWQETVSNGTLLAFHDGAHYNLPGNENCALWMNRSLPTLAAIPDIIDSLRARGFKIKPLYEMELTKKQP